MKFSLTVFFSFMGCAFGVISKKSLPNPSSQRFSPVFSSKSFMVLHFTFRSMTHFELIFHEVWDLGQRLFLLACGCPNVLSYPDVQSFLSPLNCLCIFVKNQSVIFVWDYIWLSILFPLIYVFIPLTITLSWLL